MRKKILILTPFFAPNVGGAETFAEGLYFEIAKRHDTVVCTINWGKQKLWRGMNWAEGIKICLILGYKALRLRKLFKFDIGYALGLNSALIGLLLKKWFKIKLFIVLLALYDFDLKPIWFKWICRYIFKQADKIFVEGETGKADIINLTQENKIIKFQHWCDQERFKPIERNWPELRILFVGRPIPEKGIHIIKEVERQLQGKEIKFVYIQDMPYEDLPEYYQMADVVVVPSLYSEGFSKVVIEAASCGCAIITSDRGALPELVRGWGYISRPTVNGFEVYIMLLRNKNTLLECQERAFFHARNCFTSKNAEMFYEMDTY